MNIDGGHNRHFFRLAKPLGKRWALELKTLGNMLSRKLRHDCYSRSQGLFAGVSLEGTGIATRDEVNEAYYGRPVHAGEILSGKVPSPAGARALSAVLSKY